MKMQAESEEGADPVQAFKEEIAVVCRKHKLRIGSYEHLEIHNLDCDEDLDELMGAEDCTR